MNQPFGFESEYLPRLLSSAPPLISVCAFLKAVNCLQVLVDGGADVTKADLLDRTPIFFGMASGSMAVLRLLDVGLEGLKQRDKEGNIPVHYACEYGFCDGVNYVYTKGNSLELSISNEQRQVPMLLAAENGHLAVLEVLNGFGVNLLDSDGRGWTALHYACKGGYVEVAVWLIDHEIGIDRITHEKEPAIVIAAQYGSFGCVKLLVERGSKHVKVANRAHLPIVAAAEAGHLDIVKYLESVGASRYTTTSSGRSAVSAARDAGRTTISYYFEHNKK
jgi:ankyrin repeat protein